MSEQPAVYVVPALELQISESAFQRQVDELLALCGWYYVHIGDSRRGDAGLLDVVAVHPVMHRLLFAELKTERGRLRKGHQPGDVVRSNGRLRLVRRFEPGQAEWIEALRGCPGCEVFVWKPRDWPEVVRTLNDGRITA